jgi:macrolide transport system ATP-binding/permease protein
VDALLQHLRFSARQLRRDPGFTVTVVVTLALAIGANTAIFSLVNAVLLKPLAYDRPERLGTIFARVTGSQSSDADARKQIDGQQWEMLRDDVPALISAVSGSSNLAVRLQAGSHVQYVRDGRVSARYFNVLSLLPVLGRTFTEDEDRPHGPKAAILSYGLWRSAFEANPNVLGRAVLVKGEPYTVVGVLSENATTPLNADLYTVLQPSREGEGASINYQAIARLRDGATWQQADAEINRAWTESLHTRDFVRANPGARVAYYLVPLQAGVTRALRPQVLGLMLSAGFILLIACANLAGITLVRMLARSREIATRLAIGASQWQIQKQLWIENVLLAAIGGTAAIAIGFVALRGLLLLLPEHFLPVTTVPLDARVLAFTLSIALVTSIFFGMLPALTTRNVNLRSAMTSRTVIGGGRVGLRQALIAVEVALTVVLLTAAGLMIRTLIHLETLPPGFNPYNVITAKASLDDVRYYDPANFHKLLDESVTAMRAIPGVENAAVGLSVPYERTLLSAVTLSDGSRAGRRVMTHKVYVTPSYFETLQVPLFAGRTFTDADGPQSQPVAIVNRAFARKFFAGQAAVGRYLDEKTSIVGVVSDIVMSSAGQLIAGSEPLTSEETMYVPGAQVNDRNLLSLVHGFLQPSWLVRASRSTAGLNVRMQRALASADPNLPFSGFHSMQDLMAETLTTQRIQVALLAAMASMALLLSAVGIFALVANLVAQRTREIGVRMALGSTVQQAMLDVGRSGVSASASGLVLGLLLCAGTLRVMRSVLYGVDVYDARTLGVVVVTLAAVTLLATTPALRVATIDPVKALRDE